jgi:hypothetical protein
MKLAAQIIFAITITSFILLVAEPGWGADANADGIAVDEACGGNKWAGQQQAVPSSFRSPIVWDCGRDGERDDDVFPRFGNALAARIPDARSRFCHCRK